MEIIFENSDARVNGKFIRAMANSIEERNTLQKAVSAFDETKNQFIALVEAMFGKEIFSTTQDIIGQSSWGHFQSVLIGNEIFSTNALSGGLFGKRKFLKFPATRETRRFFYVTKLKEFRTFSLNSFHPIFTTNDVLVRGLEG